MISFENVMVSKLSGDARIVYAMALLSIQTKAIPEIQGAMSYTIYQNIQVKERDLLGYLL